MKTLEDERYVVIKAYKCTVSFFFFSFFFFSRAANSVANKNIGVLQTNVNVIKMNDKSGP